MSKLGKFVDGLVVSRAKKIMAKEEEILRKTKAAETNLLGKRNLIKHRLYAELDGVSMNMVAAQRGDSKYSQLAPKFKEGDAVILNRYRLLYDGYNGWDSGPNAVTHYNGFNLGNEKPLIFKVTNVHVDRSMADELVDRFIDQLSNNNMIDANLDAVFVYYMNYVSNWRSKSDHVIYNQYGLYWNVNFETNHPKCNPKWGLNEKSFLMSNSPAGIDTYKIWDEAYKISRLTDKLSNRRRKLTARETAIINKYNK